MAGTMSEITALSPQARATVATHLISVEGWLTAYVKPHLYIGPRFEFSVIVDRAVRAELAKPIRLFVGFTAGVEF